MLDTYVLLETNHVDLYKTNSKLKMKNKLLTSTTANSAQSYFVRQVNFYSHLIILLLIDFSQTNVAQSVQREWSIDELQTYTFPYKTTNDLYLDICKAGMFTFIEIFSIQFACDLHCVCWNGMCAPTLK